MNLTTENILLIGSLLLFISIIVGKTSYKFGVPTLLLFLLIGMLAGSDGIGGIHFDNPKIAQLIGIVALNFILFSGGLDTDWTSVKPILREGIVLSTVGVLLTALSLGTFVFFVTDFTIYESMLLGSIVSSTDAAAVFSILRSKSLALKSNLRPTLELESGSNDPMAYVLTIAFLTLVIHQDQSLTSIIPMFLQQMILGGIAGFGFGKLSKLIINHINLDICAVYLGSQELIHKKTILKMYDGLAWLMQIVLFLTLGLLVYPSEVSPFIGIGLLISLFLIMVARPVSVFLSLMFFKMKLRRRFYISWVGLRGAVPIVFATYPLLAGVDKAHMIFNIVFFISVTSVLIQGTTLSIVAKWLNVALPAKSKTITNLDQFTLDLPKKTLKEFTILSEYHCVNKRVVDLDFPKCTFIVMIKRDGEYIRPGGSTQIKAQDVLMVLADDDKEFSILNDFLNKPKKLLKS